MVERQARTRRGVIAAAAAMAVGIAARQPSPANAASGGGVDGALTLGSYPAPGPGSNFATAPTWLKTVSGFTLPDGGGSAVLMVDASNGTDGQHVDAIQGIGQGSRSGLLGIGGAGAGTGATGRGGVNGGVGVVAAGGNASTAGDMTYPAGAGLAGYGGNGANVGGADTVGATGVYGRGGNGIGTAQAGAGVIGVGGIGTTMGASGHGVYGYAGGGASGAPTTGVYGATPYGNAGSTGVTGQSYFAGTIGVRGTSLNGIGVHGVSVTNSGVIGATAATATGTAGVFGVCSASGGAAVLGQIFGADVAGGRAVVGAAGAGSYAAHFLGQVVVDGGFAVRGPQSGVVRQGDGTDRLIYAVESPEGYIEDFGRGQLVAGEAEVQLDPDFVALITADDYHVFLTTYAESNGVFVTNRTPNGFIVREQNVGMSNVPFSYRVVARRRGRVGERFARFGMPPRALTDMPPALSRVEPLAPPPPRPDTRKL